MNGPEHYAEAERLLASAGEYHSPVQVSGILAEAQVHATLAMAAAIGVDDVDGWQEVVQDAGLVAVEPSEERAALVAGLRQLADLIEAKPELPASRHNLSASLYVNNMPHIRDDDTLGFAELRRIAAILGVEPDLRDEPGAMHPRAILRLAGGVAYEATYITQAFKRDYAPVEPDVVDGSPSDLDGPPADLGRLADIAPVEPDPAVDEPFDGVHAFVGGTVGGPGNNSARCACGVTFDGFDTVTEARALLFEHADRENSEPDGGEPS